MTNPTIHGSQARGPIGTEVMGVSVALPAKETQGWTGEDWQDAIRTYQPELLDMLRRHVGGAQPKTEPTLNVDGPHSDPLQGLLYVLTVSAWFNPLELPPDCPAYIARSKR